MTNDESLARAEEQLGSMHVADALRLFDLAEQANHDPDSCAGGRWTCHMLLGNFELAWRESDAITRRAKPDAYRFWDGRSVEGRSVLVRCLHGLGDTIQFIRYAPLIREKARTLAIEAQPTLKPLLCESRVADQVFTWGEPEPNWDQQIEVVELPRIFRTTLQSIPSVVPYLDVPCTGLSCPYDGARPLRVGVVWAASTYNSARSIPIEDVAMLFGLPGVRFFSLQAGIERSEIEPWSARVPSLCEELSDPVGTARSLKNLDLLITVDTMVAHLAGALAIPVWTLLPFACDWRWMLDREDSPWYPTMRLFRQPNPGDWKPVLERIRHELEALAGFAKPLAARGRMSEREMEKRLVREG